MNQIIINSKILQEALEKVLSCVNIATAISPMCEFVKFTADEEETFIEVTDMKNFIRLQLEFNPDIKGSLVISHIELLKYLKLLPDCSLSIKKHETNQVAIVIANDDIAEIPTEKLDDYPLFDPVKSEDQITVNRKSLKASIDKALNFNDTDKSLVTYNILLSTEGSGLDIYSANRNIAYKNNIACKGKFGRHPFNIDIRTMLSIIDDEVIHISVSRFKFQIEAKNAILQGVLFSEKFPAVENYFKTYPTNSFKLNRSEFDSVLRKAEIFSNSKVHKVRMAFNGELMISTTDVDYNKAFDTRIPYESDSKMDLIIGFDISLLLRAIKIEEEDNLTFLYEGNMHPMYLTRGEEAALIMPMKIDHE